MRATAALFVIGLVVVVLTLGLLYETAVEEQADRLDRAAGMLSGLMESMPPPDPDNRAAGPAPKSREAAMNRIARGLAADIGRHAREELVVGRRNGVLLQVLRSSRDGVLEVAAELEYDGVRARPLAEALAGRRGSGRFLDYQGTPVLAAYAPVPSLGIGVVYKVDMAAIRAPFIRVGLLALGLYVAMSGLLAAGHSLFTRRLTRRLEASEARFTSAFHGHQVAMGIRRLRDDVVIEANDALLRLFRRTREEIVGRRLGDLDLYLDPEHRAPFLERMARLEPIQGAEIQLKDSAGNVLNALMSVSYLKSDGEDCSLASFTDLTPLRQAEATRRSAERRARSILDSSADRIFLLDREGTVVDHNPSAAEAYGDDLAGKNIFDFGPPAVVARRKSAFDQAVASGQPVRYEDHSGQRYADALVAPICDEDGHATNVVVVAHDVTARKKAELALAEKEAHLRALVDGAFDGILMADAETRRFTFANRAMAAMLGVGADELLSMSFEDIHPPEALPRLSRDFALMAEGKISFVHDAPLRRKDGGLRSADISGSAIVLNGRKYNIGVFRDTTDYRKQEENLHLKETAIATAIDGVVICGADNTLTYANPAFLRLWGFTDITEARTTPANTLWDYAPGVAAEARESLISTGGWMGEVSARRKDGSLFPALLASSAIKGFDGQVTHLMGSLRDITEGKRREHALRESESRLKEAQRIAKIGSWELDLVSERLHWSEEVFRLFEIDAGSFGATYQAFLEAVHPEDRDMVDASFRASVRERRPYHVTHRVRLADGRIKYIEEQCETAFAPDGAPLHSRGTAQDVTERIRTEMALQASLNEKTTMLQEIHHRVKNNLQVVSSMLYFEQARAADRAVAAQFQRSRDRINAISLVHQRLYQTQNLADINFTDYARSLGEEILKGSGANPGQVALRVEGKGFTLTVTEAVPCAVILNELLTNSLKHGFAHGRPGTITIRLEADADGTRHMWTADDGEGFPGGKASPSSGASLGLRIVERLVEQLQGTFEREPAERGARFHLTIPRGGAGPG